MPGEDGAAYVEEAALPPCLEGWAPEADVEFVPFSAGRWSVGVGQFGKDEDHVARSHRHLGAAVVVIASSSSHEIHDGPLIENPWFLA
jgi:hypothetical protein